MDTELEALRSSVERLRRIVEPLDDPTIAMRAYPAEWTIAQVMSHIGSSAVILERRLDDAIAEAATPDDFAPSVWDEWNAKSLRAQVDDGLRADAGLLARLAAVTDEQQRALTITMGPLTFDPAGLARIRLNEHAFHTWDVDVVLDPTATVAPDVAAIVVDNLGLVARYTSRPTGDTATFTAHTTTPERDFTIAMTADAVSLEPGPAGTEADIELPAEAFARLVYGRLDVDHTPAVLDPRDALVTLRKVFPGP
jgi:uncharacterized protein (TIGR03083 family)